MISRWCWHRRRNAFTTPRLVLSVLWLVGALGGPVSAGPASLVIDINDDPDPDTSSHPGVSLDAAAIDGVVYFAADDGLHGRELWRSDGTAAGTYMLVDLYPGELGASPVNFAAIGPTLYFRALHPSRGCAIWRSDGSAAGTMAAVAFPPGEPDGCFDDGPAAFTAAGGNIFFRARDSRHGVQLWVTDGTDAGTRLVTDIHPDIYGQNPDSNPAALTPFGDNLYFVADDGAHGRELWRSDGTAAGTRMVRDINGPRGAAAFPPAPQLAVDGDLLVFAADDGTHGTELWVSDGTEKGTRLLADSVPGLIGGLRLTEASSPGQVRDTPLRRVGEHILFFVRPDPSSLELWRTDGTDGGTRMVDTLLGSHTPLAALVIGEKLFFAQRRELWTADGEGLRLVRNEITDRSDSIGGFAEHDGALFFVADDVDHCVLWRSDGSEAGTHPLGPADGCELRQWPDTYPRAQSAGGVLFSGSDAERGTELFVSDGTAAGTGRLADINDATRRTASADIWLQPDRTAAVGDVLFFTAQGRTTPHHPALWRSDGSRAGTFPVSGGTFAVAGAAIRSRFVFAAAAGRQVLRSADGTVGGTRDLATLAWEFDSGPLWGSTDRYAYVVSDTYSQLAELWQSDGSESGTTTIPFAPTGPDHIPALIRFRTGIVFATTTADAQELWRYREETHSADRIHRFGAGERVRQMAVADDALYLFVDRDRGAPVLLRSDGSVEGIELVAGLSVLALRPFLTGIGHGILFVGCDEVTGCEPWWSDGTPTGTALLRDLRPGLSSSVRDDHTHQASLTASERAVFAADDGVHGVELWSTDGTPPGTSLVRDIDPRRNQGSIEPPLTPLDGIALFAARGQQGVEPWVTDGTERGTFILDDIGPGPVSGMHLGDVIVASDTHLFLVADDRVHGRELWAMPRTALAPSCAGDCNNDGRVRIDELITAVAIAAGAGAVDGCSPGDRDKDGAITVNELVAAVGAALGGC